MFYLIQNHNIEEVDLNKKVLSEDDNLIGYLSVDELGPDMPGLSIPNAFIERCKMETSHFHGNFEVYDEFSYGVINIVNIMNTYQARDRIGIFIRRNMLIFVEIIDEDESIRSIFNESIKRYSVNATKEKILYGVLEMLIDNANKHLAQTEEQIIKIEEQIVEGRIDKFLNRKIFQLRNQLSILDNYYEHLVELGEELQSNSNDLFSGKELRYLKIFSGKAARLSANTKTQSENLIHLREAHDAAVNYELNWVMKVFTVVTVIFLPLTLIVGWYGMNFTTMPELTWKYGYLFVICLSITVLCGSIYYFKRKKLL